MRGRNRTPKARGYPKRPETQRKGCGGYGRGRSVGAPNRVMGEPTRGAGPNPSVAVDHPGTRGGGGEGCSYEEQLVDEVRRWVRDQSKKGGRKGAGASAANKGPPRGFQPITKTFKGAFTRNRRCPRHDVHPPPPQALTIDTFPLGVRTDARDHPCVHACVDAGPTTPVPQMMFGFGDAEKPHHSSVELMEQLIIEHVALLASRCVEHDLEGNKSGGKLGAEELLFELRKDHKRFGRAMELLAMHEEIKEAKKSMDDPLKK